jgi:hypothetical protein
LEDVFCPAARRVARIVFRAMDYLPPGEAGFSDYGRAFVNAARATYGRAQLEWRTLVGEFIRRGIVQDEAELMAAPPPGFRIKTSQIDRLAKGGQALEKFVQSNRAALGVPDGVEFECLPPVHARRSLKSNPGAKKKRETLFRFRWQETETHDLGPSLPKRWAVVRGTTLVIDEAGAVLSLLTTGPGQAAGRTALLGRWAADGRLVPESQALRPDGSLRPEAVLLKIDGGAARAEGGGRTLHLALDVE